MNSVVGITGVGILKLENGEKSKQTFVPVVKSLVRLLIGEFGFLIADFIDGY
jgi:hypothetical protein